MDLTYLEMETVLMKELRLYHHPVAVTFMFTEEEVRDFSRHTAYFRPVKPLSFCQWVVAARMQGKTVLGEKTNIDCSGGLVSFGWREPTDPVQKKTQTHFYVSDEQIERFMLAKPRMTTDTLKAVAVGPLGQAKVAPHVVLFCCDIMQTYHLSVDYMAATDTPALRPLLTGGTAACGGAVFCWQENAFNLCPPCAGNFSSGKMERGEINVFIPGDKIELVVSRLLSRMQKTGGSSITRPGEPFPGSDVCKNCPQIAFKPEHPL